MGDDVCSNGEGLPPLNRIVRLVDVAIATDAAAVDKDVVGAIDNAHGKTERRAKVAVVDKHLA